MLEDDGEPDEKRVELPEALQDGLEAFPVIEYFHMETLIDEDTREVTNTEVWLILIGHESHIACGHDVPPRGLWTRRKVGTTGSKVCFCARG
jgi:hypothetical protein